MVGTSAEHFCEELKAAETREQREIVMLLIVEAYQGRNWCDKVTAGLLALIHDAVASGDNDASMDAYIAVGSGFEAHEQSLKSLQEWLSPAQFQAWISLSEVAEDLLKFCFEKENCWLDWRERVEQFICFHP